MRLIYIIVAKCTSGFNSGRTIRQYARGFLLESPFVPSSTDCWAVLAKLRQKRRLGGHRGETGSRNMGATQILETALMTSSILTRFRDIAAFVLQHATFFHPPLVSPKFLHVPLAVGG